MARWQEPRERALFTEALSSIAWEPMCHLTSAAEQFAFFENTMNVLLDVYLPLRQVKRCSNDCPWVNDKFRNLVLRRQQAWKRGHMSLANLLRNKVNRGRKALQTSYYEGRVSDLGRGTKEW